MWCARRSEGVSKRRPVWVALVFAFALGCESECVDEDGDGFGEGCAAGPDCDDGDPSRHEGCGPTEAECAATSGLEGCPCVVGSVGECMGERAGVGECRAGRALCISGQWSACEGAVGPRPEICDGTDRDCNGLVDDGVESPCGGCTPGCVGGVWGGTGAPFEEGPGLRLTERGALTLAFEPTVRASLFVANTAEATLSHLDADVAIERRRHSTGGSEPSRVAVDYDGHAWVLNRAFDRVPTLTKIAAELDDCVDRDADGMILTSEGPMDVPAFEEDECVLLHLPVGEVGAVGRALAIDGNVGLDAIGGGNPWVGLHDAGEIVEVDGRTGEIRRRVSIEGFEPYDAIFDRAGLLWVLDREGWLARVDPRPAEPEVEILEVPLPCYLLYGLSADEEDRLLLTGFHCDRVTRYDPRAERWRSVESEGSPRGAAGLGALFVAHTAGAVSAIRDEPFGVRATFPLASEGFAPLETIGVAVDAFGAVWALSSRSGRGEPGPFQPGAATRLDPETGEITAQLELGLAPHVQGDLTGERTRFVAVPRASARQVFTGCGADEPTRWLRLHLDARPGTFGRVRVAIRQASSLEGLSALDFDEVGVLPNDPFPRELERLPEGGVIEVELTLEVDGASGVPRVERVGLEHACPGPR